MASEKQRADSLRLYLTGGASNEDPSASLGGAVSSTQARALGAIVNTPVPAVRIDYVFPACGEGDATLLVNSDGELVFTPPGGGAGTALAISAGETKVIEGSDRNKALVVTREPGLSFAGLMEFELVDVLNGVLSMENVGDTERSFGSSAYRAIMLQAGDFQVRDIRIWLPPVSGSQATYSLATESPSGGALQAVASQYTEPGGVTWVTPTTEGSALTIATIDPGDYMGLWIRRSFPVGGTHDPQENVQLAMKYEGA